MTGHADRRRGQPLAVLAALLLAWIGGRTMTWESPFPVLADAIRPLPSFAASLDRTPVAAAGAVAPPGVPSWPVAGAEVVAALDLEPGARWRSSSPLRRESPEVMAGHQLLWLAATGAFPVPSEVASLMRSSKADSPRRGDVSSARFAPSPKPDRWNFDTWLVLRPGLRSDGASGAGPSAYGASQAGAVVRYRLAPDSKRRPSAYLRASHALAAGRESELAAGVSARPVGAIPLTLHAELRATRRPGEAVEFRSAAFVVGALPPTPLPLQLRSEAYVQAGYVGGDFSTAFIDGQARVDREVARFELGSVRAGAGAWGGAQKGAARLDVGPSAALHLEIAEVPARVALDYRVRVAGDAAPGTGVAVTLSTGF